MSGLLLALVVWIVVLPAVVVALAALGSHALGRQRARRLGALAYRRSVRVAAATPLPATGWVDSRFDDRGRAPNAVPARSRPARAQRGQRLKPRV